LTLCLQHEDHQIKEYVEQEESHKIEDTKVCGWHYAIMRWGNQILLLRQV